MPERQIFVSYGQLTESERALGRRLRDLIEARPGMRAFVAGEVHTAAGLNAEIFRAIQECHAFLGVLHERGEVRYRNYPVSQRSSVWIQQEIAIFSYRMSLESAPRPIMVYQQRAIRIEGLMGAAIVNPVIFETDEEVITGVEGWLQSREFEEDPILTRRETIFRRRSDGLSAEELLFLELIVAYSVQPGDRVDFHPVRADFVATIGGRPDDGDLVRSVSRVRDRLLERELIGWEPNPGGGRDRVRIQPHWWQLVIEELRRRGRHT